MAEFKPGHFVWNELITRDAQASRAFYGTVLGWTFRDEPMGEMTYTLIQKDGADIGGLIGMPAQEGAQWVPYVEVPDVDAAIAAATGLGALVLFPPTDIPNVGRIATFRDPQGGICAVMTSRPGG